MFSAVNSQLLFEILERIECVSGIEVFVVLTVRMFDFAVVSRLIRTDPFMFNATLFETRLKQCGRPQLGRQQALGELSTVTNGAESFIL